MGIIKKPKLSMYWTTDEILQTPFFSNCMKYDRYRLILSLLHFQSDLDDSSDILIKIRPVLEHLVEKFQTTYRPGEKISIDESLLLWKGRLKFKQFNRNKRARFGIKLYQTCESRTSYSYNIQIYSGKNRDDTYVDKRIGISGKVVKLLLADFHEQGRTLYIDNWYSSPMFFHQLVNEKTNVCGTVKLNRKFVPKLNPKEIKKGEMKVLYTPKLCFIAWYDKKIVSMLTTKHVPELIDSGKVNPKTGQAILKPNIVMSYNTCMSGVDLLDQSISAHTITRKTVKWYHKVYFHLIDIAIYNSFVIYKVLHHETRINFLDFKILLVKELLKEHHAEQIVSRSQSLEVNNSLRFFGDHFPVGKGIYENGKQKFARCVVCCQNDKRKETSIICENCNVSLCPVPCFKDFHTKTGSFILV